MRLATFCSQVLAVLRLCEVREEQRSSVTRLLRHWETHRTDGGAAAHSSCEAQTGADASGGRGASSCGGAGPGTL
eukprot:6951629-Prymnesium_polylepis.1